MAVPVIHLKLFNFENKRDTLQHYSKKSWNDRLESELLYTDIFISGHLIVSTSF